MKITIIYTDKQFSKPITYTFNLILLILGIEYEILPYSELAAGRLVSGDLLISYGRKKVDLNADYQIHIYQSKLFGRDYKTSLSMPQLPLKRWNGLPVIYEGNGDLGSPVVQSENLIETNIDLIASSFFMLSRYEEIVVDEKDQYDRFPARASIAYKEKFLTRPIVNEYIDLLWKWIDTLNSGFIRRKTLWDGKDFAACLTHDVDHVKRWHSHSIYGEVRHWGGLALKKRQPLTAVRRVAKASASILSFKDPYWNFDKIMNLENRYGFSSSFYFFGGGKHQLDARYSIGDDKKISRLLSKIQDRGHEVGLHGSFDSYSNFEMLQSEKENLEKLVGEICSIRQHYLRFDIQKTFAIQEKLSIECDTTLGFAEHEGFRAGFCFPFYPYNIEEDRPYDVIELPLTIMDRTLNDVQYRGLSVEEAWQTVESLFATVKSCGGCIALLWHNSCMDEFEHADNAFLYERILKWIKENNGLGMSVRQLMSKIWACYTFADFGAIIRNRRGVLGKMRRYKE